MVSSVSGHNSEREELLAEAAILVYEQGFTQQEVADRIGVSRSTVSRLLDEARRRGIVRVYINSPFRRSVELQQELCARFGLQEARVLVSDQLSYPEMLQRLGVSAAVYLRGTLRDDMVVGVGWGSALPQLVRAVRPFDRDTHLMFVETVGSTGALHQDVDGTNLVRRLAQLARGRFRELHAPLVLATPELRMALMQQREVSEALDLARSADISLHGSGSLDAGYNSLVRSGYLREDDLAQLRLANAVGDISAHQIDVYGCELDIDLNRRVLSLTLDEIRAIPLAVGIAGGRDKGAAILGALRAACLNVLITDSMAAREILALDDATRDGNGSHPGRG
jgi:DNA-binding transcriptional regulator LsrR (DeoR family)